MLRLRGRLTGSITGDSGEPAIDMAPLIDMVFILLIFFLSSLGGALGNFISIPVLAGGL